MTDCYENQCIECHANGWAAPVIAVKGGVMCEACAVAKLDELESALAAERERADRAVRWVCHFCVNSSGDGTSCTIRAIQTCAKAELGQFQPKKVARAGTVIGLLVAELRAVFRAELRAQFGVPATTRRTIRAEGEARRGEIATLAVDGDADGDGDATGGEPCRR